MDAGLRRKVTDQSTVSRAEPLVLPMLIPVMVPSLVVDG